MVNDEINHYPYQLLIIKHMFRQYQPLPVINPYHAWTLTNISHGSQWFTLLLLALLIMIIIPLLIIWLSMMIISWWLLMTKWQSLLVIIGIAITSYHCYCFKCLIPNQFIIGYLSAMVHQTPVIHPVFHGFPVVASNGPRKRPAGLSASLRRHRAGSVWRGTSVRSGAPTWGKHGWGWEGHV